MSRKDLLTSWDRRTVRMSLTLRRMLSRSSGTLKTFSAAMGSCWIGAVVVAGRWSVSVERGVVWVPPSLVPIVGYCNFVLDGAFSLKLAEVYMCVCIVCLQLKF